MDERQCEVLRDAPADVWDYILEHFTEVDTPEDRVAWARRRGLLAVDITLALLRSPRPDCVAAAEALAGVRLKRTEAIRALPLPPLPRDPQPVVLSVDVPVNPTRVGRGLPRGSVTTAVRRRLSKVRPGQTVAAMLHAGWTRRQVRQAVADGHLTFGERP